MAAQKRSKRKATNKGITPAKAFALLLLVLLMRISAGETATALCVTFLAALYAVPPTMRFRAHLARARASKAITMAQLDDMSGQQFEEYVAHLLQHQGYGTSLTPYRSDFGADIIATKNGFKLAVQVKRYREAVSGEAVSQVVAAQRHYGCDQTMVVTTGMFTTGARTLAASNGCALVDREELGIWVARFQASGRRPPQLPAGPGEKPPAAQPRPVAHLTALTGAHAGEQFSLQSPIYVGRDAACTLALVRDLSVSQHHAILTAAPVGWVISDLDGSNGTYVNGQRVSRRVLQPEDTLQFGNAHFRVT